MTALDYSFLDWAFISSFILKGLYFSIELTVIAMVGGIAIGTALALMRLSGKQWLVIPATLYVNLLRSIPLLMVILWFFLLIPGGFYTAIAGQWGSNHRSELSAIITFTVFEAAYYSEPTAAPGEGQPASPSEPLQWLPRRPAGVDFDGLPAELRVFV